MSDNALTPDLERVAPDTYELAEGPVWLPDTGELAWVDILSGSLHRCRPGQTKPSRTTVATTLGAVAPAASGPDFVGATGQGFCRILSDGPTLPVNQVLANEPDQRMNDGRCDPCGRFVAGTTSLSGRLGESRLFRLEDDGTTTVLLTGLGISNGLCWSPDGETMYHIDTPAGAITAWPYSPDRALPEAPARVLPLDDLGGSPDGMTVDADGNLWVAFWGGGCVRCVSPRGQVLHELRLPVSQPTSCVFGGDDLATLFITTASYGLGDEARPGVDGAVFSSRPGSTGLPPRAWRGAEHHTGGES